MKYNQYINGPLKIEERGIFFMDDNGYVLYIPLDKTIVDLLKISFDEPKRRSYEFQKGAQSVTVHKT